jgi:hypothetical protein
MSVKRLLRLLDDAILVIDKLGPLAIKVLELALLAHILYKIAAHL